MRIRCNSCFKEYDNELGLCPYCGYEAGAQTDEPFCLSPGTEIADRYILGKMLGIGGFGITYKAWDKKLNITLAIKEYFPSGLVNRLPGNSEVILVATKREREFVYGKTRFLEEARNMARFSTHKNIVNVFDFFESNNTAYIVMEYLDGKTLSEVLQSQNVPLPYDYCVNVAVDICAALKSIHSENILHRDISPDNIMICSDGTVKLFDFGAARFSSGVENRVTVIVKPGFAPPEQYDKVNRQDARTDIYALGATLYYAVTGQKPEESTNRKIKDELLAPCQVDRDIPEYLSTAIMRAMAVEPQYRFASAEEFEKALLKEKKIKSVEKEKESRKRNRIAGILLSLIVILGAGAAFYHTYTEKQREATLPDANLTMWYIQLADEQRNAEKEDALLHIIDSFTSEYKNISINLIPASESDYNSAFASDRVGVDKPDIFESSDLNTEGLGSFLKVSDIIKNHPSKNYFDDAIEDEYKCPSGIVVPLIYVNTSISTLENTDSVYTIMESRVSNDMPIYLKTEAANMYMALYGDEISQIGFENAKEAFLSRNAGVLLGDSGDYYDVQERLPGEYKVVVPDCEVETYRYGSQWSATQTVSNEDEVKEAFITYLVSSLSQDYLNIQAKGDLPISRDSLAEYLKIYDELNGVEEYLNTHPFRQSRRTTEVGFQGLNYSDVPSDSWYADSINKLSVHHLMDGITKTEFFPERPITKREVVDFMYKARNGKETVESSDANDWAVKHGVISETSAGDSSETVNLETAMTMLYRGFSETAPSNASPLDLNWFSDGDMISGWALDGMEWAVCRKLIQVNWGDALNPQSEITRGRFAAIADRLLYSSVPMDATDKITVYSDFLDQPRGYVYNLNQANYCAYYEYSYDEHGEQSGYKRFERGTLVESASYENSYTPNGNIESTVAVYKLPSNAINDEYKYDYNYYGVQGMPLVQIDSYVRLGSQLELQQKIIHLYDRDGKIQRVLSYDESDAVEMLTSESTYYYDSYGRIDSVKTRSLDYDGWTTDEGHYKYGDNDELRIIESDNHVLEQFLYEKQDTYEGLIELYTAALQGNWKRDFLESMGLSFLIDDNVKVEDFGYYMKDINADGIDELFFGMVDNSKSWMGNFYDMYTLVNGHAHNVTSGGERWGCYLCRSGAIYDAGASGAGAGATTFYNGLSQNGDLIPVEEISFEYGESGIQYYYTNSPDDYTSLKPVSENTANEVFKRYEVLDIPYEHLKSW